MNPDSIPPTARAEQAQDRLQIYTVTARAFSQHDEARLVNQLRHDGDLLASSVVVIDGRVLGHAALSPGYVDALPVFTLAPVSVEPEWQNRGVGRVVVKHVLETVKSRPVSVLGPPHYYQQFGFRSATHFGVTAPYPTPHGALQLLNAENLAPGQIEYAPAFADLQVSTSPTQAV